MTFKNQNATTVRGNKNIYAYENRDGTGSGNEEYASVDQGAVIYDVGKDVKLNQDPRENQAHSSTDQGNEPYATLNTGEIVLNQLYDLNH